VSHNFFTLAFLLCFAIQGFARQLEDSEIYEQALLFSRELAKEGKRLSNVVFMGMGEPLGEITWCMFCRMCRHGTALYVSPRYM
jgi:adenine C2-methylase RlmN of 23S rRNA A2503 and tRNA A37